MRAATAGSGWAAGQRFARPRRAYRRWGRGNPKQAVSGGMKRALMILVLLIVLAGIAGGVFLAFYPIPAPTQHMEVAVPNDKLNSN
jgi:hypothetical protein